MNCCVFGIYGRSRSHSRCGGGGGSANKSRSVFLTSGVLLCLFSFLLPSNEIPVGGKTGLYNSEDEVYSLTVDTIYNEIFSSPRAWLVEFYSSWCGHCVSFAPKWKQFALDLKSWKSLIVIAAIDCADETNIPACRAFDILGYPTLKIFGPHTPRMVKDSETNLTLNIGKVFKRPNSMSQLKSNLMDALVPMFPKLLAPMHTPSPFSQAIDIWKDPEFKDGPNFLLLIYQSNGSYVGLEVALRLSSYQKEVRVLRFSEKDRLYENLGLEGWPAAGYIIQGSSSGQILLGNNQNLIDLIVGATSGLARLDLDKNIQELDKESQNQPTSVSSPKLDREQHQLEILPLPPVSESKAVDKVSMEDLLHTVRNALRVEVALHPRLDGAKLSALRNFVTILSQYFPADRREVRLFLGKLSDWIRPQRQIEVSVFMEKLDELEATWRPWDIDLNTWEDCKGTIIGRRGYTCGLWRLFHTLTIVALDKHEDAEVLPAIIGYVKHFFGCQECSTHFDAMVERDKISEARSIREQARWLWKAHNEVNMRLRGTPSEDPAYPKGIYPSTDLCSQCFSASGRVDEAKLEEYLLKVYTHPERFVSASPGLIKTESDDALEKSRNSWLGGFFSLTDIGIFMIVYLSIALLLFLGYLHFRLMSKRRRVSDPASCLRGLFA